MSTVEDVKELSLPERGYIGMAITSVFASHEPKRVEQLQKLFISRRFEIKGMVDPTLRVSLVRVRAAVHLFVLHGGRSAGRRAGNRDDRLPHSASAT